MLGLCCCEGFSLVAVRATLLVAICRLLIVVASLVAEHGLRASGLNDGRF